MKLRVLGPPDIIEPWAARFTWVGVMAQASDSKPG
jgi:hypothetical protein